MPIHEKTEIVDHKEVASEHYKLTVFSTYISSNILPGQFVNVKCGNTLDPILRRPLSINKINRDEKTIDILYKVVGKGTKILSQMQIGELLDLVGPLGNSFKIDKSKEIAILVGGGHGIAPLLSLIDDLKGKTVYALIGTRTQAYILCEKEFKDVGAQVIISTEDGSHGKKGLITDALNELLSSNLLSERAQIFACGPNPMLKQVAEIAQQRKITCQVSLEAKMACGLGGCLGCATKTKTGYKMVCKDGPIFDAKELTW